MGKKYKRRFDFDLTDKELANIRRAGREARLKENKILKKEHRNNPWGAWTIKTFMDGDEFIKQI